MARRSLAGAAVVAVVVVVSASCTARGQWTDTKPISVGSVPRLAGADMIDCGTATSCLALPIGYAFSASSGATDFGQAWDGTAWRPVAKPAPHPSALSCVGDWCMAVSSEIVGRPNAASVWDGSSWRSVGAPEGSVGSVDCVDPTFCVSVGKLFSVLFDIVVPSGSVVQRWDGQRWTTIAASGLGCTGTPFVTCRSSDASAVACSSRTACHVTSEAPAGGLERWDGLRWVLEDTGGQVRANGSVECVRGGACFVAGRRETPAGAEPVILTFDGDRWEPALALSPTDVPEALDCAPGGTCLAVLDGATAAFDGSGWVRSAATATSDPLRWQLGCASATACFVTPPRSSSTTPPAVPTFERWNGSRWSTEVGTAPPDQTGVTRLSDVSCVSDTWCMAIGTTVEDGVSRMIAQRWDGQSWALAGTLQAELGHRFSLSCGGVDRCVAASIHHPHGSDAPGVPLVARWDGSRWTEETLTPPVELYSDIDVSCNPQACFVAAHDRGEGDSRINQHIIVMTSTGGGRWTALPPSPVLQSYDSASVGISCPSPSFCGVGGRLGVAVWDGQSWRHMTTPPSGSDISCPAAGRCFATTYAGENNLQHAIATWEGSRWTTQPINDADAGWPISCATVDRCFVLGDGLIGGTGDHPLSGSYIRDGGTWRALPRPFPSMPQGTLSQVSCAGTGCMVVGWAGPGSGPIAYRFAFGPTADR